MSIDSKYSVSPNYSYLLSPQFHILKPKIPLIFLSLTPSKFTYFLISQFMHVVHVRGVRILVRGLRPKFTYLLIL